MTLGMKGFIIPLSITTLDLKYRHSECGILFIVICNGIILNVAILNVIMPSVIMLSVLSTDLNPQLNDHESNV
jgi:hypothetical protein